MQKKKEKCEVIQAKELPLLLVTWLDAGVITNGEWLTKDECVEDAKPERFTNSTVGWLLHEDATALVLSAQTALGAGSGKPNHDLVMWIPKSLIRKRKIIS